MRPITSLNGIPLLLAASGCYAALTSVTNWGDNPTGLTMAVSLPATLAENPAIVLAVRTIPKKPKTPSPIMRAIC